MTREQVKTRVQKLVAAMLPNDMDPKILYQGTKKTTDPEKLSISTDLRLTVTDVDELAQDISEEFKIHFPIDEAENAGTLGELIDAVAKYVPPGVKALKSFTTGAIAKRSGGKRKPARTQKRRQRIQRQRQGPSRTAVKRSTRRKRR